MLISSFFSIELISSSSRPTKKLMMTKEKKTIFNSRPKKPKLFKDVRNSLSRPDSRSVPIGGSEPSSGCEIIYWDSLPALSDVGISKSYNISTYHIQKSKIKLPP